MDINVMAVLAATVGQFVFGAIWYGPLFGRLWGKMHGFDKLSKTKQQELMSKMGPVYVVQFLVTILTSLVLAKLMLLLPNYSAYALAMWVWLGFLVPANISANLFNGTAPEWLIKKNVIMCLAALGYVLIAVAIIKLF